MRIKKWGIFIVGILLLVLGVYVKIAYTKQQDMKQVRAYLYKEGYKERDIFSMTAVFGKGPLIRVWVVFSDEKEATYPYANFKEGVDQITSARPTKMGRKPIFKHEHKKNTRIRLLNERPPIDNDNSE